MINEIKFYVEIAELYLALGVAISALAGALAVLWQMSKE